MFGKRKSKVKPEAAIGVSIKKNYEFAEFVNIPRIILPEPEPESEPQKALKEPSHRESIKPESPKEIVSSIIYPPPKDTISLSPSTTSSLSSTSSEKIINSRFRVRSANFKSDIKVKEKNSESSSTDNDKSKSDPASTETNGHNNRSSASSEETHENENKPPLNRIMRRKSVFAEAYNPEEEEDESERIIHAKSDEQRIRLGENVKNIFLFRSLDHDQIGEVLDAMFERRVKENEYVIKQGDDGDNFYVIESGIYNIFVDVDPAAPPKLVGKYENSGSFGELALMYNLPRAATIQAISTGSLWAMDRQTFRRIVLNAAYKKRKMYESLLEKVPMLKTLQNYERMNLADALVPRIKMAGELIIKQGDAADGMYFVEEGSVRVVMVNSDNQEKEISKVNVGGYFGELALVTKKPRAASIFAVDKVRLAFLDVEAFERLLGPCMDIMKRNIEDYENELLRIFGSQANISDIR